LLGDLQSAVDIDPEVSDSAFKPGVSEQQLNCPEVSGAPVDQRRFSAAQRLGAIGGLSALQEADVATTVKRETGPFVVIEDFDLPGI
jgi:hypothetical protein